MYTKELNLKKKSTVVTIKKNVNIAELQTFQKKVKENEYKIKGSIENNSVEGRYHGITREENSRRSYVIEKSLKKRNNEEKKRLSRRRNIIVLKLPEPKKSEPKDRKEVDTKKFKGLSKSITNITFSQGFIEYTI